MATAEPKTVEALFAAPRHAGTPAHGRFRYARAGSVASGRLLEFWLAVEDERVVGARFAAFGCPAAIACGEWVCRWLEGRRLAEAQALTGLALAQELGLPAEKRAVALTVEDALRAALAAPAQDADTWR